MDFDALMLKKAMDGVGTNESLIISILAPLSNGRISAARARHDEKVTFEADTKLNCMGPVNWLSLSLISTF